MTSKSSERLARQISAMATGAVSAIALGMSVVAPASAQSDPSVIVDLSVLNPPGTYAGTPVPGYGAPQIPAYGAPQMPAYGVPQAPAYGVSQVPAYGAPQMPVYGYPQAPVYAAPQAPAYGAAPLPAYGAPTYNGTTGYAYIGPYYGGYLVVPNAGFGPPQPTLLAPPLRAQVPVTAVAQTRPQPAPAAPAVTTPPTPVAKTQIVVEPAEVMAEEMAIRPEPVSAPPPPEPVPITPATVVATSVPSETTLENAGAATGAAFAATVPTPALEPIANALPAATTDLAPKPMPAPALTPEPTTPVLTVETPSPPAPDVQTQVAARTPAIQPFSSDALTVIFDPASADLHESSHEDLDIVATQLNDDPSLRVRLIAFAAGTDEEASKARRLSLSRALAVRGYLIKQGIRSTRMDVRALGNKIEGGPSDRVDIMVVTR